MYIFKMVAIDFDYDPAVMRVNCLAGYLQFVCNVGFGSVL